MTEMTQQYDKYIEAYDRYGISVQKIEQAQNVYEKSKEEYEQKKHLVDDSVATEKFLKTKVDNAATEINRFDRLHKAEMSGSSVDEEVAAFRNKIKLNEGKLVSSDNYEAERRKIITAGEEEQEQYFTRKEKELQKRVQEAKAACDSFSEDKDSYVKSRLESVCSGYSDVLDKKCEEVRNYLTNHKIKKISGANYILDKVTSESVAADQCGDSEETLLQSMFSVMGTSECRTKNKWDREELYDDSEDKFSGFGLLFLLVLAVCVAAMVLFVKYNLSPVNLIVPSGTSIAGASLVALQFIVKYGCMALAALIAGGILYLIVGAILGPVIGGIAGVILGFFAGRFILNGHYPIIAANSTVGVGHVTHNILAWILQIVFVIILAIVVFCILYLTPLAKLIFRPKNNLVEEEFRKFEHSFNENKSTYIALFHSAEALALACEKRLQKNLAAAEKDLTEIKQQVGYISIQEKVDVALKELSDTRKKQVEEFRKSKDKRDKDIREYRQYLTANAKTKSSELRQQRQALLENKNSFMSKLENQKKITKGLESERSAAEKKTKDKMARVQYLKNQAKDDRAYLVKATSRLLAANALDENIEKSSTTKSLIQSNGNLSPDLYFVRHEEDENQMAVIRKLPFSCSPTVAIYERSQMQSNNFSEELCHFVEWFCNSVRSVNPAMLLGGFIMIDTVSGSGIMNFETYKYLTVCSNDQDRKALISFLQAKEMHIQNEWRQNDIKNEARNLHLSDANNLDALNAVKLSIDQKIDEDMFKEEVIHRPDNLWKVLEQYHFVIFVVPEGNNNSVENSILNMDIRLILNNCQRYGIMPLFLVDRDTWKDSDSDDVQFLKSFHGIKIWNVENVGSKNKKKLDISMA